MTGAGLSLSKPDNGSRSTITHLGREFFAVVPDVSRHFRSAGQTQVYMRFWSAKTSADAAKSVVEMSRSDESVNAPRRELTLEYGSLYEGLELSTLGPCGYAVSVSPDMRVFRGTDTPIIRNTCYAVVDTFTSKIAALDPPLPAFLTTEGSWKDRRQANDLERLVEAEYHSPKGGFPTLHELWVAGFRLAAAATGAVLVRFYNDAGKVGAKIHDSLDCSISPDGSWCVVRTWYEVDDAVDLFPDREEDIRRSASMPPLEYRAPQVTGFNAPEMVCIYEGWRVSRGGKPGIYVAALDKPGIDALVWDDYPHERLPVVKLVITPHLKGPWGHALTHHVFESTYRDNWMLQSIDRSVVKTNKQTTLYNKEQLADPENSLDKSDDNVNIECTGDVRAAVNIINAPGFNPAHLELANLHRSDAHDISGVSELHTEGKREPGLDSMVAQRYVADLINERFAAVQQRYIQAVAVDSALCIVQVLCDIFEDDRKFTRTWPGQDSLREISAAVALRGIQSLKYICRPAAVSGSHNSPADRQQSAFELYRSGNLSPDLYAQLQSRGYDLPQAIAERSIQREWFDRQFEKYQFASDKDVAKPDFYQPPVRGIDVPGATVQVIDAFMEAQLGRLESNRLDYYLMLLADLSAMATANQGEPNQNPLLAPAPPQKTLPPPAVAA
jgi:hypothetical protein